MKSSRPHAAWAPYVFLAPFLLLFATFTLWPLLQSLVLAFSQTFGPKRSVFIGWGNFRFLLQDPLFWQALRNTAIYTAGTVLVQIPISLALALLLNRPEVRARPLFRLIFFTPSLVGLVFVAMVFALLFQSRTGLINAGLHDLFSGWDPEFAWLDRHIMASLIVATVWLYAGFNMIYFLAALQNVSRELLEAAALDGASPWKRFYHVVVPQIRPVLGFVILLSVIGSFQAFELPWVMLNNSAGPDNRGLTIVMYLYQTGFLGGDLGYASAIGWILGLILAGGALVQLFFLRREADA